MSRRTDKLNEQIKREIGDIIQFELNDPRIGFPTVSRVEVTTDLSYAKVFVSILGDESKEKSALIAFKQSKKFIKTLLSKRLTTRKVPELNFIIDKNLDHSQKIESILDSLDELKD